MIPDKNAFRIGMIGCGRISQAYAEALKQFKDITLTSVMDVRKEAADALAEQAGASPFYDIDSYIEKGNAQASIVCTPPSYHKSVSCTLLEAGQHVLCEKPLAKTLEEGIAMMETAKRK